jgi:hypothetical protein
MKKKFNHEIPVIKHSSVLEDLYEAAHERYSVGT